MDKRRFATQLLVGFVITTLTALIMGIILDQVVIGIAVGASLGTALSAGIYSHKKTSNSKEDIKEER